MFKKIILINTALLFTLCLAQGGSDSINSGILHVQSSVPAGVWINGQAIGNTPISIELLAGWITYSVRAPGYWSEVVLVNIEKETQISQKIQLKKHGLATNEMPETFKMPNLSNIDDIKTLENLYDSLAMQKPIPDSICIASFAAEYPALASSALNENSAEYRKYYEIYNDEKQLSFKEWYAGCSGSVQHGLNAILARIKELGNKRINGIVPVVGADFEATDLTGLNGNLVLFLRSPDGRVDVAWKGFWKNDFLTGSELVKSLTASSSIALAFLTTQNQTIWIPVENGYSRHFYKYHEFNVSWNALLIPMEGEFVLPDYILARLIEPQPEPPPSVSPPKDFIKEIKTDMAFLSKIPGGTFIYKGKVAEIKPFSMTTREVSQSLYKTKCGEKNFGALKGDSLPAHSVTWKEANSCCATFGGDLPTEAEWEYAARAGIPYKYVWPENDSAKSYAVLNAKKPDVVGSKKSNGWGLYDMFGNVAEWVKDDGFWYGKYKILKGGSYKSKEKDLNVENKQEEDVRYWGTQVGFRCVFR
jgi:hypothetical protein